jgi:cation diffusion facilitator CzcD-associated flavoprotein CzcO
MTRTRRTFPERDISVLVIGAGFGGLTAAMMLRKEGVTNFRIIERSEGVGGTWYNSRYPGAAVDVPSICYSWPHRRFAWSRNFALQPEIETYVEEVCTKEGLWDHLTLGVSVVELQWQDPKSQWRATLSNGEMVDADIVISAVGLLTNPRYPDWPGYADFRGPKLHTAAYDQSVDLAGKRVAVVGVGSSAAQVIPTVAKVAKHVHVYQREPGWVLPKGDYEYSDEERTALHGLSDAEYRKQRWQVFRAVNKGMVFGRVYKPHSKISKQLREAALGYIADTFKDRPDLQAAMTPGYGFAGKRLVLSSDLYPALLRDNVTLIPHGVERLTATGVVDTTGADTEIDALILATGYDPAAATRNMRITGRAGKSLADIWGDRPTAFFGITVPGFPNLFMMYGPSTHGGMIFTNHQAQAHWAIRAIRNWRRGRRTYEVKPRALKWYIQWLDHEVRDTAWQETGSYVKNADGKIVTQWPWDAFAYLVMTRIFGKFGHKAR